MLAVIGGTGLTQMPGVRHLAELSSSTPLGEASSAVIQAELAGQPLLFLARHGHPHRIPPHKINYRANLLALQAAGASQVVAVNAVGGIDPKLAMSSLVLPDQLIDYTWGRESTYFDGDYRPLDHIDFSYPYSEQLRRALIQAAHQAGVALVEQGVYAATQGPRLETAAEIQRLAKDGCTLVGMTGMPEAALARELGLEYAGLSVVVNPAAGLGDEEISLSQMQGALKQGVQQVMAVISALVSSTKA